MSERVKTEGEEALELVERQLEEVRAIRTDYKDKMQQCDYAVMQLIDLRSKLVSQILSRASKQQS